LLTRQNAALLIIDYQPVQAFSVASRNKRELVANIVALSKIGKLYELPTSLRRHQDGADCRCARPRRGGRRHRHHRQ
jgi:hypothetical protein